MPPFSKQLIHPGTGKKLQIYVDGTRVQLIRVSAQPEATAVDEVVQLKTEEAAQHTAQQFIEAQLAKGYIDAQARPKSKALMKALDTVASGKSDPREALATMEKTGTPQDVKDFVQTNAKAFFGALAKWLDYAFFDLEWRGGFVDAATIDAEEALGQDLARLTAALLSLPVFSRVRQLRFAVAGASKHGPLDDWTRTFAAVTSSPAAGTVELLGFDFAQDEMVPPLDTILIGDFSRGWASLKKLKTLSLRGQQLELSGARVPALETLRWESARLSARDCDQLLGATMPRLRSLELAGGPLTEKVAKQLLGGLTAFPALASFKADLRRLSPKTREALAVSLGKAATKKQSRRGPASRR